MNFYKWYFISVVILLVGAFILSCQPEKKESNKSTTTGIESTSGQAFLISAPSSLVIPEGMVFVPGGMLEMGDDEGLPHERPEVTAKVQAFLLDRRPVTVEDFRKFVDATEFITQAEDFGNGAVFNFEEKKWELLDGANWKYPQGPDNNPAPGDHPVTQVSWNDAAAYCGWAGKRLPTEREWEHAARNAKNLRNMYPWGNEIQLDGAYMANTWQGAFPFFHEVKDGYATTSPVGAFPPTPLGLYDMMGNVWEWCDDWKLMYNRDIKGFVANEASEKVMRGGSFLCEPGWCHGYRVSARSGSTPESSLFHVGFRCAKDIR